MCLQVDCDCSICKEKSGFHSLKVVNGDYKDTSFHHTHNPTRSPPCFNIVWFVLVTTDLKSNHSLRGINKTYFTICIHNSTPPSLLQRVRRILACPHDGRCVRLPLIHSLRFPLRTAGFSFSPSPWCQ